jgi:tRNA threonylcarbamoyl adenosine modification protein YjeE
MRLIDVPAADLQRLEEAAAELAPALRPGDAVALQGDLGAGKTTFVRALVRALGGGDEATSPTFTFWHRYATTPPVNHLDLYRIEQPGELADLGLEEAFDPASVTLVEWPERAPHLLPAGSVWVRIEGAGAAPRSIAAERR